jgi:dihydropteroate synthase
MLWQTSRFELDLSRPLVMGIVNVTPDSFSDGGRYASSASAIAHAESLLAEGADVLDIGGESTRPGSPAVSLDEELARVMPVLRAAVQWGVPVSVDTYKPELMQQALDLGADIINDIWALRRSGALSVVAAHPRCGLCLMHMHRDPQTMQVAPMSGDVVSAVTDFLAARVQAALDAGISRARLAVDPGIGFGKTVAQNFALLREQSRLSDLDLPVLAGWSRKSSLGAVTGQDDAAERISASVAAALLAVQQGARVVRVHDVRATVDALAVWRAMRDESGG